MRLDFWLTIVFLPLSMLWCDVASAQGPSSNGPSQGGAVVEIPPSQEPDAGPKTVVFGADATGFDAQDQEQDEESTKMRKNKGGLRVSPGGPTYLPGKELGPWESQSFAPLAKPDDQWRGHRVEIMLGANIPQPGSNIAWRGVGPGIWFAAGYHYRFNPYLSLGLVLDVDGVFASGVQTLVRVNEASGGFQAYTRRLTVDDYTFVGGRPVVRLHFPVAFSDPYALDFFGEGGLGIGWAGFGGKLTHEESDIDPQSTRASYREYAIHGSSVGPYATFGAGTDFYFLRNVGAGLFFRWAFPLTSADPGSATYKEPMDLGTGASHTWVYSPTGRYTKDGLEHEQFKKDDHDRAIRSLGAMTLPAVGVHAIVRFW